MRNPLRPMTPLHARNFSGKTLLYMVGARRASYDAFATAPHTIPCALCEARK